MELQPNTDALYFYLLTGYEDEERTFFADVRPVGSGKLDGDSDAQRAHKPPRAYWFPEKVQISIRDPREASESYRDKLMDAVRVHLHLGRAGGLFAERRLGQQRGYRLRQSLSRHPVKAPFILLVSFFPVIASMNAPTYKMCSMPFLLDLILIRPHRSSFFTISIVSSGCTMSPSGHFSQYNAYALARLTRAAKVPVILNGQGGDELLAGYWQSFFAYLRGLAARGKFLHLASHLVGASLPYGNREMLWQIPIMLQRYRSRTSKRFDLGLRKDGSENNVESASDKVRAILSMTDDERRIFELRSLYLPRLLKWDDRNFMAFAIEGRYPFLDHELVEHTLSFSREVLYRAGWTKEPMRKGLSDMLPRSITRRRTKLSFEAPQDDWLNKSLSQVLDRWIREDAPLWEYVDRTKVLELLNLVRQVNGRSGMPGQVLFRLFMADRWLRVFFDGQTSDVADDDCPDSCAVLRN